VIFDSLPAGEIWRAFQNYDEVENAPETAPGKLGAVFLRGFLSTWF
jgi:hypothetical protein